MNLDFNQADFLLHCIDVFAQGQDVSFIDYEGNVLMTSEQIKDLFLQIQEIKFTNN